MPDRGRAGSALMAPVQVEVLFSWAIVYLNHTSPSLIVAVCSRYLMSCLGALLLILPSPSSPFSLCLSR